MKMNGTLSHGLDSWLDYQPLAGTTSQKSSTENVFSGKNRDWTRQRGKSNREDKVKIKQNIQVTGESAGLNNNYLTCEKNRY